MVYLELVKIFPPRKLAKPLGFMDYRAVMGPKGGGLRRVVRVKELLCTGWGLKDRLVVGWRWY